MSEFSTVPRASLGYSVMPVMGFMPLLPAGRRCASAALRAPPCNWALSPLHHAPPAVPRAATQGRRELQSVRGFDGRLGDVGREPGRAMSEGPTEVAGEVRRRPTFRDRTC